MSRATLHSLAALLPRLSLLGVLGASWACSSNAEQPAGSAGSPSSSAGANATGGSGASASAGASGASAGASGSAGSAVVPDGGSAGLSSAQGGRAAQSGSGASAGRSGGGGNASSGGGGGASGPSGAAGAAGAAGASGAGASGAGPTLATLACGKAWANPAKGETWIHDPSLTRDGNTYYLFSTPAPAVAPAVRDLVPFKTSTDGVTWKKRGTVFSSALPWWSADIPAPETWAADVHRVGSTYYLYYSISAWFNFNSSIGLATNTTLDPANPSYQWVDRGKVIDFRNGGTGVNVIDPNLFVDDDGSFWLVYGSFKSGLRLVPLDPKTGKLLTDPPAVTVLTKGLGEGSDLIKHGGYYYLMVSTGSCCAGLSSTYHVGMGRSRTIAGPYLTKDNKSMVDGAYTTFLAGDATHPGQGGQSFYEENGQHYIVYHAYTAPSGDPVINVRPMYFDAAGWPTLDPCQATP